MLTRFHLPRKSAVAVPLVLTLALAATACGDDDDTAAGAGAGAGAGRPHVVVTTSVLGDVVENLVGDSADVEVVMPAGSSPHEFQASPRQVAAMREADAMIVNGAGFEEGLGDAIEAAEADGVATYAAIDAVETLTFAEDAPHDDEEDEAHADEEEGEEEEHGPGSIDPHFFTDPTRVATAAQVIADFLADEVPALDTDELRTQTTAYVDELTALDAEMKATLATVPANRRKLVTNHEVFGYFAQRYDFEVIGAVIPTGTTQAAPSAGELDELAHTIEDAGVLAIFAETSSPTELADSLAAEVGEVQVVELFTESLGPDGSDGDTYAGMMRSDAEQIADALAA
jgi:zinc/manganese transport system substrate-binding protein